MHTYRVVNVKQQMAIGLRFMKNCIKANDHRIKFNVFVNNAKTFDLKFKQFIMNLFSKENQKLVQKNCSCHVVISHCYHHFVTVGYMNGPSLPSVLSCTAYIKPAHPQVQFMAFLYPFYFRVSLLFSLHETSHQAALDI